MTTPPLRAPAKLNVTLEVLDRRSNGLHAIRSVMVPLDLCDELTIRPRPHGFSFSCSNRALQDGNLVERAARAAGVDGVEIHLHKRIPTQAGMGGGSSDAAAVLLAVQAGLLEGAPDLDYLAIAASIGSDVPFFLTQTAALVEGTGERVTALGAVPPWHAIVVKPPVPVATGDAYAWLDETPRPSRPRNSSASLRVAEALQRADFDGVLEWMQNDFHDVLSARIPDIAQASRCLEIAGAERALLCGSGSCVFALAPDEGTAALIASRLDLPPGYASYVCALYASGTWRRL